MLGLEEVRGLREGEITLQIDNGARIAAVVVGTYLLWLLLGFSLIFKGYYYISIASKNLISIFVLA